MRTLSLTTLLLVVFYLVGCVNPSVVRVNTVEIGKLKVQKIYIPRFEGNPDFVEESTEYFIAELEPHLTASIVQGSVLRTEPTDILSGGNLAPAEIAMAKAKAVGAQALIMGKVTSHHTSGMINGFSTIRIINVANGEILASFHRPSGLLFAYSEHQCIMAAVARTAKDVAEALR